MACNTSAPLDMEPIKERAKSFITKWYECQYAKEMPMYRSICVYKEHRAINVLAMDGEDQHMYIYTERNDQPSVMVYKFNRYACRALSENSTESDNKTDK